VSGVQRTVVSGRVGGDDPLDHYRFSISRETMVSFVLATTGEALPLRLFHGNGSPISTGINAMHERTEGSLVQRLPAGTYAVQVGREDLGALGSTYELTITLGALATGLPRDDFAGSTIAQPRPLGAVAQGLHVFRDHIGTSSDAADVYAFRLLEPAQVALRLGGLVAASSVSLLDAAGATVASHSTTTNGEASVLRNLAAGLHHVRVTGSGPTGYSLSMDVRGIHDGAGASGAEARPIGPVGASPQLFEDRVGGPDRADVYALSLAAAQRVVFRLDGLDHGAAGEVRASLRDAAERVIATVSFTGPNAALLDRELAAGGYFLHVENTHADRMAAYRLAVANAPPPPPAAAPPPDEAGNSVETARWLNIGAWVVGTDDHEELRGTAADDVIEGRAGDDVLRGGAGADRMLGGAGSDQYVVDDAADSVVEHPHEGGDTAWVGVSGWVLPRHVEVARLFGEAAGLLGSPDADSIVANAARASRVDGAAGDDHIWGGALAHTLIGGAGDDVLRGEGGAAEMHGGAGHDQFVVGHLGARVVELADDGYDTAWVAVDGWTNAAHVEVARLAAPGARTLFGAQTGENLVANPSAASGLYGLGGDDVLWGSPLADTLDGGEGHDIMRGQGGADLFIGGADNDQFVVFDARAELRERAGEGYDIAYFVGAGTLVLAAEIEDGRLSEAATGLVGNALANLLVGNSGGRASLLRGEAGHDMIFGTAAGDTIAGGAGDDTIMAGGGADRVVFDLAGWGADLLSGFSADGRLVFTPGSGVSGFSELSLREGGGNTLVNHAQGSVLVFGRRLSEADFIFG
jgi:Ca2+-binding RTX toxin-like protein